MITQKLLSANAAIGLYPANSLGDDVEVYSDESRENVISVLHMLRQQAEKTIEQPYLSLADFIAPRNQELRITSAASQ